MVIRHSAGHVLAECKDGLPPFLQSRNTCWQKMSDLLLIIQRSHCHHWSMVANPTPPHSEISSGTTSSARRFDPSDIAPVSETMGA